MSLREWVRAGLNADDTEASMQKFSLGMSPVGPLALSACPTQDPPSGCGLVCPPPQPITLLVDAVASLGVYVGQVQLGQSPPVYPGNERDLIPELQAATQALVQVRGRGGSDGCVVGALSVCSRPFLQRAACTDSW